MKILAYSRPKVSQVEVWRPIASVKREYDWRGRPDGDAIVYEASNFYDYYKVSADGKNKYFFGETAYHDFKRYLGDLGFQNAYWIGIE